jgi:alpha-L-fucosidase 2
MKIRFFACFVVLVSALASVNAQKGGKLKMWYDKPATVWNEALPVGNGRLGAMIYGNPSNEKIRLNEATFWSGGPSRNDNPNALQALPEVRKLIFEGNYFEAEKMINQNMVTGLHGSKFQVIGDLSLAFAGQENYSDYYRELDLERAVFTTTYKVNGVTYKREVFASQPDQLIVVKLSADKPKMLTFTAGFNGPLQKSSAALPGNVLEMNGLSGTHEGVAGQVKFNARAKVIAKGGSTVVDAEKINVKNATEVVILVSIATNFVDYQTLTANEAEKSKAYLTACEKKTYKKLYDNHLLAYQGYFNRATFNLGTSPAAQQPTDVRILNFSKSYDPELVSMYYQFGRYLLISSSQPGGQPANLQGIWNESVNPAWDSKYTININTEMNYWPAEKCNLAQMHEPLIQMVKELSQTGQKTARHMYGCDGWVAHHNTDIWRITGVVDGAYWGMWPMGGAWLSQHLWEKYLYDGDLKYLESVFPILESACKFYKDFLIEEPTNKWLVVSPSISPENNPAGRPSVCAGATMDNQLLFDLFSRTIKAAKLLNKDKADIEQFQNILHRLPPMQIGKHGQLQEWMGDLDDPNDKHRHVSHLYGLYPSNQISPTTSPELFNAARTTLVHRGDVSTGWSMGWKVNFWARLRDGNHAMKLIKDQLTLVDPIKPGHDGGTYPNFFDAHPPFQIDGNFGCTAGIAEMLLQCHDGAVHFLPALPNDWRNGEITGLRTYGGFEVGFSWKDGQVQSLVVKSSLGGNLRLRLPNHLKLADGKALIPTSGVNPNPFFEIPDIKRPLVSDKATLSGLTGNPSLEFDIETSPGQTYSFVAVQ